MITRWSWIVVCAILWSGCAGLQKQTRPDTLRGAAAAKADASPDIPAMLRYALQDEYAAKTEYAAILKQFGDRRPFSNIIRAEERHIAAIRQEYRRRSLPCPQENPVGQTASPKTLRQAYALGAQAEVENIAMYDRFLASPKLHPPENETVRALFLQLRAASTHHLRAFRNKQG